MDLHSITELVGLVVTVASAIASGLNEYARSNKKPSKGVAAAQIAVNLLAANFDKVKQAAKVLKK
jgi:hypothetical protein